MRTTAYHQELARLDVAHRTLGALRADVVHHRSRGDDAALRNAVAVGERYAGGLPDARHPAAELLTDEIRGMAWALRREALAALEQLRADHSDGVTPA